ncbi:MAG: di-trans,poly-cis-decaprenylcistransferase [Nitrososphaerota archaeon]|nr:di-trans,poly-cis-decaprenylcistransferase [Nitrososphaerota archaeon]MDG6922352.1 di-trans,poly-cis-decaprenylcistransferase [Nitrososphaerota archaeon]
MPSILNYLGVYKLYESFLSRSIKGGEVPKHIAIILDGNRRWASTKSIERVVGHIEGANTAEELLEWCHEIGIKTITLYLLSTENLDRSQEELKELFDLFADRLNRLLTDERITRFKVRVKAIGRLELLTHNLQTILRQIEVKTADYSEHFLNIAIAYGGRTEIVDSVKKIAILVKEGELAPDEIDQKTIEHSLYTSYLPNPDPDLVIRTSGEERLSGFLLWQSAYSELVFVDEYWPDFRKIDLMRAVRTYQRRARRFGR